MDISSPFLATLCNRKVFSFLRKENMKLLETNLKDLPYTQQPRTVQARRVSLAIKINMRKLRSNDLLSGPN